MASPTHLPPTHPAGRRLRLGRRIGLLDVVVFSLPAIALGLYLFGASVLDYQRIRQFDDWWSNATSVRKFGWYRARAALNAPRASALENELDFDDPQKGALLLEVDMSAWRRVDRDVGGRWGEWIDATIVDGGDLHGARVRFRGDGSVHWTGPKKSLTVRCGRGDLYQGQRDLILSTKDVLPQVVANALGGEAGVLAPDTRPMPVYLNRTFYGLFRWIEAVDEGFLRRRSRMPGNVYRGDTAERGEYFKDVPRELFANPYIWDRAAANDRPGATGTEALLSFVAELDGGTFEDRERLFRRLDREELARLFALLLVTGDPYHMSGVHNQLWYENPTSATLHPIVWDLRLLELGAPPPGSNLNRFWRTVLRDPLLWADALRHVARALEPGGLFQRGREIAREAEQRYSSELAFERLRDGVISPVGSADAVVHLLEQNATLLSSWVADAHARWSSWEAPDGTWGIDVVATGRAPLRLVGLELELEAGAPADLELVPGGLGFARGGIADIPGSVERDGARSIWRPAAPYASLLELPSGLGGQAAALEVDPIAYRFTLRAAGGGSVAIRSLSPVLMNALTSKPAATSQLPLGQPLPEGSSWHPWRFDKRTFQIMDLDGDVHLTKDLVLSSQTSLAILPGTHLRLDPDVSILSHGRVLALGTAERPITIEAADPGRPWGAFALQGAGASGSRFSHVSFRGGGCALLEGVEYKGMVDVHNSSDVVFSDCSFADNLRCDDAINVVRSKVDLIDCVFERANADAIDYDLSSGDLVRLRIEGSGNDGLDLMTSDPRILAGRIRGSGDKGISVGEGSRPLVLDTSIEDCVTGIEPKDRSEPLIVRTRITGCRTGLHQYAKNWRYGGPGWARLVATSIEGNALDYEGEDGAYLTTLGSKLARVELGAGIEAQDELGADVAWMLDSLGLPGVSAGRVLEAQAYEDERGDPTGGWSSSGGAIDLRLRRGGLSASIVDRQGSLARAVDWTLPESDRRHLLVLEVAGENVGALEARAAGPAVEAAQSFDLHAAPQHFRFATLALPPGRYTELVLSPRLSGRSGRVVLRSWRLLELPPAAGGM